MTADRTRHPDAKRFETITELLCYLPTPDQRAELDQFRIKFETEHGPTDLTKNYTTRWPQDQQRWLLAHSAETREAWLRGAPDFVREYFKQVVNAALDRGEIPGSVSTIQWIQRLVGGHACPPPQDSRAR